MNYTLKGQVKKFLELTLVGQNKMVLEVIEQILTASKGEIVAQKWSHKNIAYAISIDNDGYTTRYYVMRGPDMKTAFTFVFNEGEFKAYVNNTELLYRTWKELV